jgi:predicted Zn-dependent protease with MMP-like domain
MIGKVRWLFSGGSPSMAFGVTLGITIGIGLPMWTEYRSTPGLQSPLIFAPLIPIVFLIVWAATAKVRRDVMAVHEENSELAERSRRADERFLAHDPGAAFAENEFTQIVEHEIAALPAWIAQAIQSDNVAIDVADELPGQPRTLGLYRRIGDTSEITLYRLPLSRAARSHEGLRRAVHDTLLHELGHLFGMTERDLDDYTIGNNPRPDAQRVHPPSE